MLRPLALAACLPLLVCALSAQAPKPQPKPAPPAAVAPGPKAAGPVWPSPSDHDKLEQFQLENVQLRLALITDEENSLPQRKSALTEQYGSIIQKIQAEHPGYVWNPQLNGLVPAPPPAKPAQIDDRETDKTTGKK